MIDAFAPKPLAGNPAAVVLLLQAIAGEFNLAETAFPRRLTRNRFELRWFTPAREAALCGHATLAAAHALWVSGAADATDSICSSLVTVAN